MEIDKIGLKQASEVIRSDANKELISLEKSFLRKLVGKACEFYPEYVALTGKEAEDFIWTVVEINEDVLPRLFKAMQKRREMELDREDRETLP